MTVKIGDRVKELASTTGTGSFTLTGAVSGFAAFSSVLTANGDTTYYCAVNGSEWEVGLGTRSSSTVLARTTVIAGSNGTSLVNFTAAPTVFCTVPASKVRLDVTPDSLPSVANVADDEFEGSALDTTGTRASGATAWTWRNQGTGSAALTGGALALTLPANSPNGDNLRMIEQVLPSSGTWKYRAKIMGQWTSSGAIGAVGMGILNSGTGKLVVGQKQFDANRVQECGVTKYNSVSSYNSNYIFSASNGTTTTAPGVMLDLIGGTILLPTYFEIEWNGTNYIFRASQTGVAYITLATFTPADFVGTADRIFLGGNPYAQQVTNVVEWFRRVA